MSHSDFILLFWEKTQFVTSRPGVKSKHSYVKMDFILTIYTEILEKKEKIIQC